MIGSFSELLTSLEESDCYEGSESSPFLAGSYFGTVLAKMAISVCVVTESTEVSADSSRVLLFLETSTDCTGFFLHVDLSCSGSYT